MESGDKKHDYARTLCHYALEFTDAWSEGDGPRVVITLLACDWWQNKVFPRSTETSLQIQLAVLSPNLVQHLTWGRFINTRDGLGHNIPCDLHNEHVNRLFKDAIAHMGANFTHARGYHSNSSLCHIHVTCCRTV